MSWQYIAIIAAALFVLTAPAQAQQVDEDELGAWYVYIWSVLDDDRVLGWQGTVQYRNWDIAGDLEQLLINVGPVFTPRGSKIRFAVNYAYVATGAYGTSSRTFNENRLFEEVQIPGKLGKRWYLFNRLRLEQRWIDGQNLRNRFRWLFMVNVPINKTTLKKGAVYVSFYNELFINFEKDIGNGREVDRFDRDRIQLGMGYSFTDNLRAQLGYMYQETSTIGKGQLQLNVVQAF